MRLAILGNSGSGKSTLAQWLARQAHAPVLDLDTVAWEADPPPVPRPAADAEADVRAFCLSQASWIVEGCYADLVRVALGFSPTLVFLNPGEQACLANCRSRPWEPHKYASKEEQGEGLPFLLSWVSGYYSRSDQMSLSAHAALYAAYEGEKHELTTAPILEPPSMEFLALVRSVPGTPGGPPSGD